MPKTMTIPPPAVVTPRSTWLHLAIIRLQDVVHACHLADIEAPETLQLMLRLQGELRATET
jgi:hypothetical protein